MTGHPGELWIITANVNSLRQRSGELANLITEKNPDVLCLQETLYRSEWSLPGYREVSSIAASKHSRAVRGNKLLVRDCITAVEANMQGLSGDGVELVAADIVRPRQQSLRIISTYVSPSIGKRPAAAEMAIDRVIQSLLTSPLTIVVGDLNSKLQTHLQDSNISGDALQMHIDDGTVFAHMSDRPTRYDPAGRVPSTIDIAVTRTNNVDLVNNIEVLDDIGSDHRPVLVKIPCSVGAKQTAKSKPNFEKADWSAYRDYVSECMPGAPQIAPNKATIDRAVVFVEELIQQAEKAAIPRKVIRPAGGSRLLPPAIVGKIKMKRNLRNRLQKKGDRSLKPEINLLNREIQADIKVFEEQQHRDRWERINDKSQWGFYPAARRLLKPNQPKSTFPLKDRDGILIDSDEDKVEEFRLLYTDIYKPPPADPQFLEHAQSAKNIHNKYRDTYSDIKERPMGVINSAVTVNTIRRALRKTRNTSPGADGIYYSHIKNLPDSAMEYIAELFTVSWRCSYFPQKWKEGVTILIPKPGKDHSQAKNYRPITLLSALGKIFERVINGELIQYLESSDLLPESQAGFRKHRSTQDKLFELVQDAKSRFANSDVTVACLFDIEKAFDKMCHEEFTMKMHNLGIPDEMIGLIVNYLSDRSIRLKVGDSFSSPVYLKAGTPQGSILSPTLFGIWVSDLPQPPPSVKVSQFADDTATWCSHKNVRSARCSLQRYNTKVTDWCRKWKILLSPQKTQVIAFSKRAIRNPGSVYQTINGIRINASETVTFLGVVLDQKLKLNDHQRKIITELRRRTSMLAGITGSASVPRAPSDIGRQIVQSMIESVCYYACVVSILRSDAMFRAQDQIITRAYRLALHAPKTTRSDYIRRVVGLEPSKTTALRLSKDYIFNRKRSPGFKTFVADQILIENSRTAGESKTPLGLLL